MGEFDMGWVLRKVGQKRRNAKKSLGPQRFAALTGALALANSMVRNEGLAPGLLGGRFPAFRRGSL
jgi:hypothetical protein